MIALIEKWFERGLWASRLVVLAAVFASLASSFALFFITSVDVVTLIAHLVDYIGLDEAARSALRLDAVGHIVNAVDGYLLATILLIFALGLYELFISKIDPAENSSRSSKVLYIKSLDDLKDKLAKVILMILVVTYFEHTIQTEFSTPLDLIYFALGIALVSLALFLAHKSAIKKSDKESKNESKNESEKEGV